MTLIKSMLENRILNKRFDDVYQVKYWFFAEDGFKCECSTIGDVQEFLYLYNPYIGDSTLLTCKEDEGIMLFIINNCCNQKKNIETPPRIIFK